MTMRSLGAVVVAGVLLAVAGCGRGPVMRMAAPPSLDAAGLQRCALAPSQLRPLLVEWAAADRGSLEVQLQQGPVVVRYEGCALEVLPGCSVPGRYDYSGFTHKRDLVTIRSADELYAHMPLGADRLAGRLERADELQVELNLVGQYLADRETFTRWELAGQCRGATHVIQAAQVGAFAFTASTRTHAGLAGAERAGSRELLNADGDAAACATARPSDAAAPDGCAAVLRLEFTPLFASASLPGPLDAPLSRQARRQSYASEDYRDARRWTAWGGILVGLSAVGAGMIVGGFVGQDNLRDRAAALDPHAPGYADEYAALRARARQMDVVGFVGVGMAAVLPVFGGLALDYGLGMMRATRDRFGPHARVQVAPSVGRNYGGLEMKFRF